MSPFSLLCVAADVQMLAEFEQELAPLLSHFNLVVVAGQQSAEQALDELEGKGQLPAVVVCDSDLGDGRGADFLIHLGDRHDACRKILLGSQPEMKSIIEAVNLGRLDYYLQLPWRDGSLRRAVIEQASHFVLQHPEVDLLSYAAVLDNQKLLRAHVDRKMAEYRQGFMDYTHCSDEELSRVVIEGLYQFFEGDDEAKVCLHYSPGHVLTREGEPNRFLWFIAKGEVVLRKRDEQGIEQEVVHYRTGSLVGGMSFVTGEPAFTTAVTLTGAEVIKLDKLQFSRVMQARSELLPSFTSLLLRHFNRRLQNSIRTEIRLQQTLNSLDAAYAQLVESEKMAVLGQLVAGVAHELNNPVAAIIRGSETLRAAIPDLVNLELPVAIKGLGNQTLCQALTAQPVSTSEIRDKTRQAEGRFGDRQQARLAVQMHLDDELSWQRWFAGRTGAQREALLAQLELFQQTGSFLRNIEVCARRIGDLVKSLKQYARQDGDEPSLVDLHEGLEDTLMIFENRLKQHELCKEYHPLPPVRCHPIALQQVWTNLIGNSLDAMSGPGRLTIRTALLDPEWVMVEVEDSGCGIPPELRERIFDLNFTTKREGHFGLGIGLSVALQIVQQHHGRIEVASEPGRYTRMRVCLPLDGMGHASHGGENHHKEHAA
ncbi:cyclic nucleotide-binding domain-containing protein [Aeromonas enteropelogenes]|uniref:ATP-binding protein n=1 Tax=Aeromonas enteropelogenes TaxID=29489 RepID=UPI00191EA4F0|nr:ATP-binding protein [Aeromonas enteropelogenes]MBL0458770.1 cyclic nucleotide-binding domain-containing protein [Aeromonas enteropelogenes]